MYMNNERVRQFFCNQSVFTASLVLFTILFLLKNRYGIENFPLNFILSAFGIVVLVCLFDSKSFSVPVTIRKGIGYIGTHTLEIYLLHYFFVPKDLPYLVSVIAPNGIKGANIVAEFLVCFGMAIPVIALSLLTASIIKKSKALALLYLGKNV